MLADGRRLIIYMDEFWQWLNNDAFRDFVYNKLKTGRKLDMVLVVATQSPDELIKTPIAAAVREQCATHIYLANPKAKRGEYVDGLQVKSFILTKLKLLTRFRVSSWWSKTHSGRANAMTLQPLQS
jgi:type IV secretion system protein VirB4